MTTSPFIPDSTGEREAHKLGASRSVPGVTPIRKRLVGLEPEQRASTYSQVVDQIGVAICDRVLIPGTVVTVEELEAATGASRSVVRESTRVLAAMGLLRPKKRVGLQVLDENEWNLFDPQVIRWRLSGTDREAQVRALLEVRMAIEPEAARLAARNASAEHAGRIMSAAGRLWSTGIGGEQVAFLRDDAEFHGLILQASGNSMFAKLSDVIHEALRERALHQLHEKPIDLHDAKLHVDIAGHIMRRDEQNAWECAREIILRNTPQQTAGSAVDT